jgi:3-isopropylmalate dehydrogenase
MDYRIGIIECDGIGPEVVGAARSVMTAAIAQTPGVAIELVELIAGSTAIERTGQSMPDETIDELTRCHGWLLGPHDSASYPVEHREGPTPSGRLRKHFQLYANYRPVRGSFGLGDAQHVVDLCVVRENTEGFYADRNMAQGVGEFMPTTDVALAVGVFTRPAIERIVTAAFELARGRRRHVTLVHKANVLKVSFGLYVSIFEATALLYPDVTVDSWHVDAAAAELVKNPADFDVIVTENMFGDILSELAAELTGGLGLAPSLNAGDQWAMAQATHGAAPTIAGKNVANPIGEILSVALLFDWLGRRHDDKSMIAIGDRIKAGVARAVEDGARTADQGGHHSTSQIADAVVAEISA